MVVQLPAGDKKPRPFARTGFAITFLIIGYALHGDREVRIEVPCPQKAPAPEPGACRVPGLQSAKPFVPGVRHVASVPHIARPKLAEPLRLLPAPDASLPVTFTCNDGFESRSTDRIGACSHHGGTREPSAPSPIATPDAPATSLPVTFICNDGYESRAVERAGACSHHGGIREVPSAPQPSPSPIAFPRPRHTGIVCRDGSHSASHGRRGACSHHGGIR